MSSGRHGNGRDGLQSGKITAAVDGVLVAQGHFGEQRTPAAVIGELRTSSLRRRSSPHPQQRVGDTRNSERVGGVPAAIVGFVGRAPPPVGAVTASRCHCRAFIAIIVASSLSLLSARQWERGDG